MMNTNVEREIKTRTIRQRRKNGDIYIIERQTVYDPEKKYNVVLSSRIIEKITNGSDDADSTMEKVQKDADSEKVTPLIRQGIATNKFTKLPSTKKTTSVNPITGDATISRKSQDEFAVTIPNFKELVGLRTSAFQLFDALVKELTRTGANSPRVVITLDDYMNARKLKDRKAAKERVVDDMNALRFLSISWDERKNGRVQSYKFINLADSGDVTRDGHITFKFGSTFYQILKGYPVMYYPPQLDTINNKKNPNSFYFLRKLAEHKNMNVGKKNENVISVMTLLECAPFIPSYEDVMDGGKQVSQRIIEPFERDMDALDNTLSWTYCHSNDTPLTDQELLSLDYDLFIRLMIKTEWKHYPDQTERIERKKAREKKKEKKYVKKKF